MSKLEKIISKIEKETKIPRKDWFDLIGYSTSLATCLIVAQAGFMQYVRNDPYFYADMWSVGEGYLEIPLLAYTAVWAMYKLNKM